MPGRWGILSKVSHRHRSINNVLIVEAVKYCSDNKIPYMIYAKYDYGKFGSDSLFEFKRSTGFENMLVPRYFVGLTPKGKLAIRTGFHGELKNLLPASLVPHDVQSAGKILPLEIRQQE